MINLIDIILAVLLAYFFLLGFIRGFLRSIFGPLALIAGSFLAYIYYQSTHNTFITFAIGLFAPMIIGLFLRVILSGWLKSLNPEALPSALSRFSGALVTLIWGWTFVIFTIILIDIFPGKIQQVVALQTLIHQSRIAQVTALPFRTIFLPVPASTADANGQNIKDLAQDPRLASIMNDPAIKNAAEKHDYVTLIKNPAIMKLTQEMMADPTLMKKVLAAYGELKQKK